MLEGVMVLRKPPLPLAGYLEDEDAITLERLNYKSIDHKSREVHMRDHTSRVTRYTGTPYSFVPLWYRRRLRSVMVGRVRSPGRESWVV